MLFYPQAELTGWFQRFVSPRICRLQSLASYALKNARPPVDLRSATDDPLEAYYRAPQGCGFIINLNMDRLRTFGPLAFSCASQGGSPFVETLLAYQQGKCGTYRDSPLRKFYETWQPANLAEGLLINPSIANEELLHLPPIPWLLPWSGGPDWDRCIREAKAQIARRSRRLGESYALSRFSGPVSERYGELRFANLTKVYRSISANGYHPVLHVRANLLVRGGECRAIISDGNHRAAALAVVGYNKIPILVAGKERYGSAVIRRGDVCSWPAVRAGLFCQQQAIEIFDRIFDANSPILQMAPNVVQNLS